MTERLLGGDRRELLAGEAGEGPAGGGEKDAFDGLARLALQALEDGGEFAIDGEQAGAGALGDSRDHAAGHDEGFLVGEGDVEAELERGGQGGKAGAAGDRRDDEVGAALSDQLLETGLAGEHARAG